MYDGLFKTDDGAALRFYYDTAKNNAKSEKSGRAVYDKVLLVEVITPGSKESCPVFTLERYTGEGEEALVPIFKDVERCERYGRQMAAFKSQSEDADMIGTPIDKWPSIDIHISAALKEARVFTVEALASLPDSRLGALGQGSGSLRARAKAFLEAAKGNAPAEALAARNVVLEGEIASLNEQLRLMSERMDKLDGIDDGKVADTAPAGTIAKPGKTTV